MCDGSRGELGQKLRCRALPQPHQDTAGLGSGKQRVGERFQLLGNDATVTTEDLLQSDLDAAPEAPSRGVDPTTFSAAPTSIVEGTTTARATDIVAGVGASDQNTQLMTPAASRRVFFSAGVAGLTYRADRPVHEGPPGPFTQTTGHGLHRGLGARGAPGRLRRTVFGSGPNGFAGLGLWRGSRRGRPALPGWMCGHVPAGCAHVGVGAVGANGDDRIGAAPSTSAAWLMSAVAGGAHRTGVEHRLGGSAAPTVDAEVMGTWRALRTQAATVGGAVLEHAETAAVRAFAVGAGIGAIATPAQPVVAVVGGRWRSAAAAGASDAGTVDVAAVLADPPFRALVRQRHPAMAARARRRSHLMAVSTQNMGQSHDARRAEHIGSYQPLGVLSEVAIELVNSAGHVDTGLGDDRLNLGGSQSRHIVEQTVAQIPAGVVDPPRTHAYAFG